MTPVRLPDLTVLHDREASGSKIQTDFKRGPGLEMAQWLRTLHALPEDLGSVPSTYMQALYYL